MLTRNRGIIRDEEQVDLAHTTVAIAGVGGGGGHVAVTLARMGVGGFTLADPEDFEIENLNRQAGCTRATIGRNKAVVIRESILAINPDAKVRFFPEGITDGNLTDFLADASLVIDETEYTRHWLAVMLARAARERQLAVVTGFNIAFGALLTSFQPNGMTLEEYLGLDPDSPLEVIRQAEVPLERWIPVPCPPSYLAAELIAAVATGEIPAPSVAPGVYLVAGMVATEAFNQLVGRQAPVAAPTVRWFDALDGRLEDVTIDI
jgi:molybdopterin/thiamine biosynthesis adenylyltransferase